MMICPICNQDTTKKYLGVLLCKNCTHIFSENVYDREYWAVLYENSYTSEDRKFDPQRNTMYAQEILWINKFKQLRGSFLDVGCSYGNFFLFLPKEMKKVGLEISQKIINDVALIHQDCEFHKTSLYNFNTSSQFDFIQFRGVLQHSDDPVSNLKSAIPKLAKNGVIIVASLPDFSSFTSKIYKEKFGFYIPKSCPHFFTKKSFNLMLKNLNLKIVNQESPYFHTPYSDFPKDLIHFLTNRLTGKKNPPFYGNVKNYLIQVNKNE